jgi:arylsulfatase A-like enzyme
VTESQSEHPRKVLQSGSLVWLLVAGAMLAALGDVAVPWAARVLIRRYTFLNPYTAVLTPLAWVVVVAPVVTLVHALGARRWPSHAVTLTATLVALAAVLEPLLVLRERINWMALLVVAAGIAVQVGRWYGRQSGAARVVRRVACGAMVANLAIAAGWSWHLTRAERRQLNELSAASAGTPNLLFLVLDTVRAMELGLYGGPPGITPWLDSVATAGVRFDRAFATASWTLPSHATMFTGRYPFETTTDWHVPLDESQATLAEELGTRGYATAAFSANLRYVSRVFGLSRGFAHFDDFAFNASEAIRGCNLCLVSAIGWNRVRGTFYDPGRRHGRDIGQAAVEWLDDQTGTRPWFVFMNLYDAHSPYWPDPPFDTMYATGSITHREPGPHVGEDDPASRESLQAYRGALAELDRTLRGMFDTLRARGQLDNTVVVITSDHGEHFGEHRISGHGSSLYSPVTHVPLFIVGPGLPSRAVLAPVTLRDLPATLLGIAGGEGRATSAIPGQSLLAAVPDSVAPSASPILQQVTYFPGLPPHVPTARGDLQAIVADGVHLSRRENGAEELYDINNDPLQRVDVIASPDYARHRANARRALEDAARGMRTPLPAPRTP